MSRADFDRFGFPPIPRPFADLTEDEIVAKRERAKRYYLDYGNEAARWLELCGPLRLTIHEYKQRARESCRWQAAARDMAEECTRELGRRAAFTMEG